MIKLYILFAILLIVWIIYGNIIVNVKKINVSSKSIPKCFDGFKIAQISDLHNTEFGKNNNQLISLLKKTEADIIVITGDIINSRRINIEKAVHFAKSAVGIAPVYYVNGNHESRLTDTEYNKLIVKLEKAGVTVLVNNTKDICMGDETITIVGIGDPSFEAEVDDVEMERKFLQKHIGNVPKNDNYKVLLTHRPEYLNIYKDNVDLVLTGHAHGGQFIIPFIGGLFSPGQGILPKYYDGLYENGKTKMIVSRGVGHSSFPFRLNNNPVIVVAKLMSLADK